MVTNNNTHNCLIASTTILFILQQISATKTTRYCYKHLLNFNAKNLKWCPKLNYISL